MNQERSIELIHADLDGEISAEDQDELHALIQGDAGLATLRDELRKLNDVLGRVDAVDAPPELRSRILAAIHPARERHQAPVRGHARPRRRVLPAWPAPALFRYAAAAVFGAAVVAVGLTVSDLSSKGPAANEDLVGTMTSHRVPGAPGRGFVLDNPSISGSVGASVQNGLVVVDFDLAATQPVEIVADYGQTGLSFSGFAQFEEASASVESAQGRVRFVQQDAHKYAVFFRPSGQGSGAIDFQFLADGKLIHEEALEIPATGRN